MAIDKLWGFLQSLSLAASNERWLAERLLESAKAKAVSGENVKEEAWPNYQFPPEISGMLLKNRKLVSDNIENALYEL